MSTFDKDIFILFLMQAVEEMEWNLPTDVQVSLFKNRTCNIFWSRHRNFHKCPCILLPWKHTKVETVTGVIFWSFTLNFLRPYLHKRNQG
jgi:hypothetical protein